MSVLIDPGTYIFYNATMTRNHEPARNYPGEYSTDLISAAAVGFLDEAIRAADRPFFLGVAPIAPHSETVTGGGKAQFSAPVPAKRHEHLFGGVRVPRAPNFNPNTVSDVLLLVLALFVLSVLLLLSLLLLPSNSCRQAQPHTSSRSGSSTRARLSTTTSGTASGCSRCSRSTS